MVVRSWQGCPCFSASIMIDVLFIMSIPLIHCKLKRPVMISFEIALLDVIHLVDAPTWRVVEFVG